MARGLILRLLARPEKEPLPKSRIDILGFGVICPTEGPDPQGYGLTNQAPEATKRARRVETQSDRVGRKGRSMTEPLCS